MIHIMTYGKVWLVHRSWVILCKVTEVTASLCGFGTGCYFCIWLLKRFVFVFTRSFCCVLSGICWDSATSSPRQSWNKSHLCLMRKRWSMNWWWYDAFESPGTDIPNIGVDSDLIIRRILNGQVIFFCLWMVLKRTRIPRQRFLHLTKQGSGCPALGLESYFYYDDDGGQWTRLRWWWQH